MRFSIVIPVFNGEGTLGDCLESILQSDMKEVCEIIVVDDNSTDASPEIAESYHCVVHKLGKNHGPSYARNFGAKHAQGETLVFIDSDVCIPPDMWRKLDDFFVANPDFIGVSAIFNPTCKMTDPLSKYNPYFHWSE